MCFEECRANALDRRDFVAESAALLALGGLGSPVPGQDPKPPPTRVLDDPSIQHGKVVFRHNGRDGIDGYLARPKAEGAFQAVLAYTRPSYAPDAAKLAWSRTVEFLSQHLGE